MGSINTVMSKYAAETGTKTNQKNEFRVQVGQVFMQPTKANTNFAYCYYGMYAKDGSSVGGFNMSNKKMLECVEAGLFGKDFLKTFEAYAEKYHPTQIVLK